MDNGMAGYDSGYDSDESMTGREFWDYNAFIEHLDYEDECEHGEYCQNLRIRKFQEVTAHYSLCSMDNESEWCKAWTKVGEDVLRIFDIRKDDEPEFINFLSEIHEKVVNLPDVPPGVRIPLLNEGEYDEEDEEDEGHFDGLPLDDDRY